MSTDPYYYFGIGQGTYSGNIPANPGLFSVGTPDIIARVGKSNSVSFAGAKSINGESSIYGQAAVDGGTVLLQNLGNMLVGDLLDAGNLNVDANDVAQLAILGSAGIAEHLRLEEVGTTTVQGAGAVDATVQGTNGLIYLLYTPIARLSGSGTQSSSETVVLGYNATGTMTRASNFGLMNFSALYGQDNVPENFQLSNIGTVELDVYASHVLASNVAAMDLGFQRDVAYRDASPAKTSISASLVLGSFTLLGGSEDLGVNQSSSTTTLAHALTFDLTRSTSSGSGININLAEGAWSTASGDDAIFKLGAANTTLSLSIAAGASSTGAGNEIIGGSGTNVIIGNAFGTEVTFGTGSDTVTGGSGQNSYQAGGKLYASAGPTSDTITDFKVGTDILQLSRAVQPETEILSTPQGDRIQIGTHDILLAGVTNFQLSDIHWGV